MPSFFSNDAQKDLGMLVILEHVLTGERFGQYSSHLSPQDRPAAKSLLENQRSILRQRVQSHLDAAYGLEVLSRVPRYVARPRSQRALRVSGPGFVPQPPVAANLSGAMQHLLSQALEHEFPAAPHFEAEVKSGALKKVYESIEPAAQMPDGRLAIEKTQRPLLRQIANPLMLGEMGVDATHFVLGQHWKNHFIRKAAETGGAMTVGQLRKWIDDPKPMGLPKEAQNLVILLFAAQTNRTFYLHGSPSEVSLTNIADTHELRGHVCPPQRPGKCGAACWVDFRSGSFTAPDAGNVSKLTSEVKKKASEIWQLCRRYRQRLGERATNSECRPIPIG